MGFFDIIKRSLKVTNRNLAALLVQILYIIAIFAVLAVMALVLIAMFAGTLSGLGDAALNPENLFNILKSSLGIIVMGVVFLFLFILTVMILNAVVQSGIIGCLARTAEGEAGGFSLSVFFTSVKASSFSLFWLQVIVSLIWLGVMGGLALVGVISFGLVLLPLKESGSQLTAFAIGVPLLVVLILAALIFLFLLYAGGMLAQISLVSGARGALSSISDTYEFISSRFWDAMLFTLLVVFIVFGASMVIELLTMPLRFLGSDESALTLIWLLPALFVANILKMYVGLFSLSCFVVYYAAGTGQAAPAPQRPVDAGPSTIAVPGEELLDAVVVEPGPPDNGETGGPLSDIESGYPPRGMEESPSEAGPEAVEPGDPGSSK